jgi:hypothetical protein
VGSLGRPHTIILTTIVVFLVAIILAIALPFLRTKAVRTSDVLSLMGAVQSLKQCVNEPTAWSATVREPQNDNGLRCVFEKAGCAHEKPIGIQHLLSQNSRGPKRFCLPGYDLSDETQGLSPDGLPCKGFGPQGSDECPYRIDLNWVPYCGSGETTCRNPQEEVVLTLKSFPGSKLGKSTAPVFSDGLDRPLFKGQQSIGLWRNEDVASSSVVIAEALPPGFPGGPCKELAGTPSRRMMNLVQADPTGRAATEKDGTFWLKAGQYDCRLSVPGFKVGTFRAAVLTVDGKQELLTTSNGYSSSALGNIQARAEGIGRLILPAAKNHLQVVQLCTETPLGTEKQKFLAMGVPMGVGPEIYAVLDCQVVPEEDI